LRHRQSRDGIDLDEIAGRLRGYGKVVSNEFMVRAELSDGGKEYEITLFADGRAIVKGTGEAGVARGVYSKYVGN
jgi:adenylyltransferase/sulfurtransferase